MEKQNNPKWYVVLKAVEAGKIEDFTYVSFRFLVGAIQEPIGKVFESAKEAREFSKALYEELKVATIDGDAIFSHSCPEVNGPVVYVQKRWKVGCGIPFSFQQIWQRYGDEIVSGDYHISPTAQKQLAPVLLTC
jgi:hypothetical protein